MLLAVIDTVAVGVGGLHNVVVGPAGGAHIGELAQLAGVSSRTLRYYDRIGLLCPEQRGENNYRYYARHQLNSAYLIGSLRLLEVGLEDIRRYSTGRTPERMLAFFAQQEERIQAEIEKMKEECGTTVLSIAHRLSTLQNCDEIIVMDKGCIVQRGTYRELERAFLNVCGKLGLREKKP